MIDKAELREQEAWLRREGLGLLIPAARRARRLPTAMAPFLVFAILIYSAIYVLITVTSEIPDVALEDLRLTDSQLLQVGIGVVLVALSIPVALAYQLWQRRRAVVTQWIAAGVVWLAWLTTTLVLENTWIETLALIVIPCVAIYLEVPSILRWAMSCVRRSLPLLGPMVAHVLPYLLLAQLLVFFTNEMWQMAYQFDKARMWAVCGLLFVPTVLLTGTESVATLRRYLDQQVDAPSLLAGTPFAKCPDLERPKLRLGERINLVILPTVAQLIQVLLFVGLVFLFFVGFGSVALPADLISKWTGEPPVRMIWLGIAMPLDLTMFRVAMMLSVFSGLSFAASNAKDDTYQEVFLAPIVNEMERGLAARRRCRP